jgi:hypothetical protein
LDSARPSRVTDLEDPSQGWSRKPLNEKQWVVALDRMPRTPEPGVTTDDKKHINAINGGLGIQDTPRDCGKSLTLLAQSFTTRCVSTYSQAKFHALARRLNERPRKTLDFQTPAEMFQSDRCIDRLNPHSLAVFDALRVTEECGERSPPRRG